VAYPALDPSGLPATLSPAILGDLLRGELGHEGLVVTDALIMKGVLADAGEGEAAIRALEAGCDALLYPRQLEPTLEAVRGVYAVRGDPRCAGEVEVLVVDDDVGGPFPLDIPRDVFADTLAAQGVVVHSVDRPTGDRPLVMALFSDIRGFKGRPGVSAEARRRVEAAASSAPATVVLFGPPRLAAEVGAPAVLCAWGGEPLMQRAAALWLSR